MNDIIYMWLAGYVWFGFLIWVLYLPKAGYKGEWFVKLFHLFSIVTYWPLFLLMQRELK